MLFLQFKIGNDRYLIDAKDIIEVVPFAALKKIPKAPPYVAGLLNYRGKTIPVIDICYLMTDRPCKLRLSSRIALINYKADNGELLPVGFLIEQMTESVRWLESDFSDSRVNLKDNKYLGRVVIDDEGIAQRIEISMIIPEEADEILCKGRQ